ncbi:hypothetical protein JCM10213_002558 [Rhodosporidiobolus nylandii]
MVAPASRIAATSESGPVVDPFAPTESGSKEETTRAPAAPPTGEEEQGEKAELADPSELEEDKDDESDNWGIKVEDIQESSLKALYEAKKLEGFTDPQDVVYPYSQALNDKVFLWRGDITTLEVDCIVNAANKSLLGGGGVDGAIHRAAGSSLYDECKTLGGAETGETKLTRGHDLPAKHIAHTVGPIYNRGRKDECEQKLRSCYRGTLELCVQNGLKTVAFSGISTGVYGYPLDAAAQTACDEVRKFLEGSDGDKIDAVIFTVFRQIDVNSYLDNLPAYFPPPPSSEQPEAAQQDEAAAAPPEEDPNAQATAVDAAQDKPPIQQNAEEEKK